MYEGREYFEREPDPDAIIWRYMDLSRYLSILEDQKLFLGQATSMPDTWEGAYPAGTLTDLGLLNLTTRLKIRDSVFMSCWYVFEHESAAMWEIYQKEGRGVAIQSTWRRLTESINTELHIAGGLVEYVDYRTFKFDPSNVLSPFVHKRLSFEHEREARLIFWLYGDMKKEAFVEQKDGTQTLNPEFVLPTVVPLDIDVDRLVARVLVAPNQEEWFGDLVEKVSRKYGHEFPVTKSDLYNGPIY
jgi:hypothetical protein